MTFKFRYHLLLFLKHQAPSTPSQTNRSEYQTIFFNTPVKVSNTNPEILKCSFKLGKLFKNSTSSTTLFSGLPYQSALNPTPLSTESTSKTYSVIAPYTNPGCCLTNSGWRSPIASLKLVSVCLLIPQSTRTYLLEESWGLDGEVG